jgi:hypothetical protein
VRVYDETTSNYTWQNHLEKVSGSEVHIYQPKKKPKGKELTPEEKAENKIISSIRILIEHIIAGVKRCRIVKDVFRNTKLYFADQVMEIACGLHNFRTTLRYNTLE